ncbi:hypothetical protein [Actinomadura nitritigenes]|uniref:hypothetical protein n=1 Tax=Actinomadura nitritigenes TaxID=134602 RepID=UPI003D8DDE23
MALWVMFSELGLIELLALREGKWLGYGASLAYGLIWVAVALGWLAVAHGKMGLSGEKAAMVPAITLTWLIACTLGRPLLVFDLADAPKAPRGLAGRILINQVLFMAGIIVIVVIASL